MGRRIRRYLRDVFGWFVIDPIGRLVLTCLIWALVIVALALFADRLVWLGFALGVLLPVSLWIAYEGFWLPKRSRLQLFLAMTPAEFEQAVADLIVPLGFTEVRVIAGHDDYGVDVLCRDRRGHLVAIQCKRYQPGSTVSSSEVQTFIGGMEIHKAHRGIIVTTSSFTGPAREVATKQDIRLIDGPELSALLGRTLA